MHYQAVDGIRFLDFGDESIVLNPLSWDAHLLNAAAAEVVARLANGAKSFDDIQVFLREALMESERPRAAEHAQRLLGDLTQLGLVRVVSR